MTKQLLSMIETEFLASSTKMISGGSYGVNYNSATFIQQMGLWVRYGLAAYGCHLFNLFTQNMLPHSKLLNFRRPKI